MTPRGSTRMAAVLGHPVAHSRSPALHNAAYAAIGLDAIYVALDVAPGRVEGAVAGLAALGFMGANVTVPHKEAALRACPWVDQVATRANAVNTIVVEGADIRGYNTDVPGLVRALREEAPGLAGGRAVVLGGGGAARAAILAARELGYEVSAVVRRPEAAVSLRALDVSAIVPWTSEAMASLFATAGLLIDATSMGMSRESESMVPALPPLEQLADTAVVASLVYHRAPALLEAAKQKGLTAIDGGGMLVHQAALAFELMTGRTAPLEAMQRAFADAALLEAAAGTADPLPENADAPR